MLDERNHSQSTLNDRPPEDALAGQTIHLRQGVDLQVCYTQGQTPSLVFLHGGLANRFNWRAQYEFAQAQGWEVFTYDLGGHGQSSPYRRYSLGRHRRDLTRLLKLFNIQAPILCCHSYGVPLGLEWAQRHPVSGLIAVCGGTHNLAPWWEMPLMKSLYWGGRHFYHLPGVQRMAQALTSSHRHSTIERFFAESPIPTHPHPYEAIEIFWGYNFFTRYPTHQWSDIPVLVINGDQDPSFTPQMGAELAACFPQGQQLSLPNAGHLVMVEYPEIINDTIAAFMQRVAKTR